jgi:hypothetical protein
MQDGRRTAIAKLRKIEALARATSAGERRGGERAIASGAAQAPEKSERALEYRFALPDGWSKSLFIALLRRYGIEPYRYRGQRRTTVMARVTRTFADEVLWPEFQELNATLRAHLESVTSRVIAQAIHGDPADAEERPGREPNAFPAGLPRRRVDRRNFLEMWDRSAHDAGGRRPRSKYRE